MGESLGKIEKTAHSLIRQCGIFLDTYNDFCFINEKIDLAECVKEVIEEREFGNIDVVFKEETENKYIMGNQEIIKEMAANIIQNSIDALGNKNFEGGDSGKIVIKLICESDMVCLSFYDNGTGIELNKFKNI